MLPTSNPMTLDLTTAEQLLKPGALIGGRYEVVRTLGHGGMGAVLQVIDRALEGEMVALKLLYPHLAADKTSFARFRNEVLLARRLSHPNIVRLYDIGNAGGGYYFLSMEYVNGGNLTKLIYEHRNDFLSFKETVRILRDLALGMSHAHKAGVVHRDLKPDNILLADGKEVKITDFGLARSLYVDKGFTDTGEAVGTPYYMAPEQLRGDRVDARCDIYALGLIAFEMVVGRRPFFEESYLQLAALHLKEPIPDFATKESGIPKWYEDFVKNCSEKNPDDRFQSADEIAEFLSERLEGKSEPNKLRRRPAILSFYADTRRKKVWKAGSIAALVFFCALGFGALWHIVSVTPRLLGPVLRVMKTFTSSVKVDPAQLNIAVRAGDLEQIRTLVAAGVELNPKDTKQPLLTALEEQKFDIALFLLENGASPNAVHPEDDTTALMKSVKQRDAISVTRTLLEKGANVNARDKSLRTPLMHAADAGNVDAARLLLDKHAMMGVDDNTGATALHHAVKAESAEFVRLLLQNGKLELNTPDQNGRTPLFDAAELPESEITEILLDAKPKADHTDNRGKTAADDATTKNRKLIKGALR